MLPYHFRFYRQSDPSTTLQYFYHSIYHLESTENNEAINCKWVCKQDHSNEVVRKRPFSVVSAQQSCSASKFERNHVCFAFIHIRQFILIAAPIYNKFS